MQPSRCIGSGRLFVTNVMSREAAQERDGRRSPKVTREVDSGARTGEFAPEMCEAVAQVSIRSGVEEFLQDLRSDINLAGYGEVSMGRDP